ncbi:class II glutamine amidotransferase [Legionella pneumophila]|uniref:Glutamine amidotransferase n=1 Tax=Legionella pneumophila subsp. pascullei TaxID=91890 RepID=A0AAX2J0A8_LEGPN|nr:class II glutamine amidotransferase [Legionella pneumophila]AMP93656.1 class II glutamine amidotransferase [Legionella pneumophila subsp. pascullei]AMP96574.1 class II glutamine amidotransferase [Legionella pneumophila subsp. pascullei]SQG91612.1 putative glutamine amidotransferase [Legionella pneumophila subsp. pascullei]VEH08158.1 putative glutamine amidotransferase [Legionella pneumophila subsp. pascullei]HAT6917483.1 class II glutamine amidotransferase [Legionella pneumophila]
MCRILSYLGQPTVVEELLYKPDNSFIKQSYHPKYLPYLLNLAGFGMAAWDRDSINPLQAYVYKTSKLPFYDENLHNLAEKIAPHCLLAHLRGVSYHDKQVVTDQNVHPFLYPVTSIALAHNGMLYNFETMRYDLLKYVKTEYRKYIKGTTDSEWIYAVFLSQLENPKGNFEAAEIINAVIATLKILKSVRQQNDIVINSPVNLFLTNGDFIAATRFCLDYGWKPKDAPQSTHFTYHSLWYTYGERYGFYENEYKMKGGTINSSIIIASEPLTENTTTWLEVPEYTLIFANQVDGEIKITSQDINI